MTDTADILKIAVTGSAGSGKSLVLKAFASLGLVILDCDQIARDVVEPGQKGYDGIIDLFGRDVVKQDQTLDRALLRNRMMDAPDLRAELEALLHPLIYDTLFERIRTAAYGKERACAVEVPLLFETGMEKFFDASLVVVARDDDLVRRISERDKVPVDRARQILSLQMPQAEKIRRADHAIRNEGTPDVLCRSVENFYQNIVKEFLTRKT